MERLAAVIENRTFRVVQAIILIMIWGGLYLLNEIQYTSILGSVAVVLLVYTAFWLVIRAVLAKNILLVMFFAFIALYTIPAKEYFFDGIYLSAHNLTYTYDTFTKTTLIFSLFLIAINAVVKMPLRASIKQMPFFKNDIIFFLIYILSFVIVILSKRSGSFYDASNEAVEVSAMNEYVIIFFLILYLFSNGELLKLYMVGGLYFLYAFFALINGGRIEIVLLLFMLLAVRFQYTVSFKKLMILFIVGVWGMTLFGAIRSNPMILLSENFTDVLFLKNKNLGDVQNSNEGDVYWASERLIVLMDANELAARERVDFALSYGLSPIVPGPLLPSSENLSTYKKDLIGTGGGGLAPVFFFVMFGLAGVVFLGIFIGKMLNTFSENRPTSLKYFYAVLLVTTLPRWFAYYPVHIIKFCVIGVLVYFFIKSLNYTVNYYTLRS